jgi:hypothetical protein
MTSNSRRQWISSTVYWSKAQQAGTYSTSILRGLLLPELCCWLFLRAYVENGFVCRIDPWGQVDDPVSSRVTEGERQFEKKWQKNVLGKSRHICTLWNHSIELTIMFTLWNNWIELINIFTLWNHWYEFTKKYFVKSLNRIYKQQRGR